MKLTGKIFIGAIHDGTPEGAGVVGFIFDDNENFKKIELEFKETLDFLQTPRSNERCKYNLLVPAQEIVINVNEKEKGVNIYIELENKRVIKGNVVKGEGFSDFCKAFNKNQQIVLSLLSRKPVVETQYYGIEAVVNLFTFESTYKN